MELDDLVNTLAAEVDDIGLDDDLDLSTSSVPDVAEPAAAPAQETAPAPEAAAPTMGLVALCQHCWGLASPDEDGCLDGGQLRPLLLMSQLPSDQLATIWGLVDTTQLGKVGHYTALHTPHSSSPRLIIDNSDLYWV